MIGFLSRMAATLILAAFLAQGAEAATKTFTLDQDDCGGRGGCGAAPYGTVTLTEITPFQVDVLVTLVAPVKFVNTGAGSALAFSMTPGLSISLSNMTSGFTQDSSPKGIGKSSYSYAVACSDCGKGASNPNSGPLFFSVISTAAITVSDFIANASGYFFSADVLGKTDNTGNVGTKLGTTTTNVPEPASLALLAPALAGLAVLRRRRR